MDQTTFERQNSEILVALQACGINVPQHNSDKGQAITILQSIIDQHHTLPSIKENSDIIDWEEENQEIFSDVTEALETLENKFGEDDFYFEFDGNEYRLILDSAIWEIYRDGIQHIVEDCYELNLDKVPNFVALSIDWEQTAQNAFVDGYAHHFSNYDGETDIEVGGYHVFYTN